MALEVFDLLLHLLDFLLVLIALLCEIFDLTVFHGHIFRVSCSWLGPMIFCLLLLAPALRLVYKLKRGNRFLVGGLIWVDTGDQKSLLSETISQDASELRLSIGHRLSHGLLLALGDGIDNLFKSLY